MLVAVQLSVLGLYLPPLFKLMTATKSAPDDHFTACPHRGVQGSGLGRVGRAGGYPIIADRIVSAASVEDGGHDAICPPQTIISLPVHTAV